MCARNGHQSLPKIVTTPDSGRGFSKVQVPCSQRSPRWHQAERERAAPKGRTSNRPKGHGHGESFRGDRFLRQDIRPCQSGQCATVEKSGCTVWQPVPNPLWETAVYVVRTLGGLSSDSHRNGTVVDTFAQWAGLNVSRCSLPLDWLLAS